MRVKPEHPSHNLAFCILDRRQQQQQQHVATPVLISRSSTRVHPNGISLRPRFRQTRPTVSLSDLVGEPRKSH